MPVPNGTKSAFSAPRAGAEAHLGHQARPDVVAERHRTTERGLERRDDVEVAPPQVGRHHGDPPGVVDDPGTTTSAAEECTLQAELDRVRRQGRDRLQTAATSAPGRPRSRGVGVVVETSSPPTRSTRAALTRVPPTSTAATASRRSPPPLCSHGYTCSYGHAGGPQGPHLVQPVRSRR